MKVTDKEWMEEQFEKKGKSIGEVSKECGEHRFRVAKWKRRFGLGTHECDICDSCEECKECGECDCEECEECGKTYKNVEAHIRMTHEEG